MGDMTDSSEITELPPLSSFSIINAAYWINSSVCFVLMSSLFIFRNQRDLFDVKLMGYLKSNKFFDASA